METELAYKWRICICMYTYIYTHFLPMTRQYIRPVRSIEETATFPKLINKAHMNAIFMEMCNFSHCLVLLLFEVKSDGDLNVEYIISDTFPVKMFALKLGWHCFILFLWWLPSPLIVFLCFCWKKGENMHPPPGVVSNHCKSFYQQSRRLITAVVVQWEIDGIRGN